MDDDHILIEKKNRAGIVTLNRPEALNALSFDMFARLSAALAEWQSDPEIYGIAISSNHEDVFCAGGDIREVYERGAKSPAEACAFIEQEYQYNWQLNRFTKPHVALMNGKCLGGGVGISLYGTHRVAGDKFSLGMPETAIGFVPDVGGSWFLGHLPNSIGLYLALTGRSIGRADAYATGLVTHTIDEQHFPSIIEALQRGEPVDALLDDLQSDPGTGELKRLVSWIEAVFSASTLDEIFKRANSLGEITDGWSLQVLEEMRQKSPLSLHLAHRLWKKGKKLNLRRALKLEYAVVCELLKEGDFYEGVRALLIDKDKKPVWSAADISDIEPKALARYFETGENVLGLEDSAGS